MSGLSLDREGPRHGVEMERRGILRADGSIGCLELPAMEESFVHDDLPLRRSR